MPLRPPHYNEDSPLATGINRVYGSSGSASINGGRTVTEPLPTLSICVPPSGTMSRPIVSLPVERSQIDLPGLGGSHSPLTNFFSAVNVFFPLAPRRERTSPAATIADTDR